MGLNEAVRENIPVSTASVLPFCFVSIRTISSSITVNSLHALTWIQSCRVSTEAYTGTAILPHVASITSILAAVGDAFSVRIVRSATFIILHKRGEQSKYNYFQRNEDKWEQNFLQLSSNFLPLRRFVQIFLAPHC